MTTLTVIAEGRVPSASGEQHDYIRDLTRSIVATAPRNCEVETFLTSSASTEREYFERSCPGASINMVSRDYQNLMRSWSLGLTGSAHEGLVHSPTLFAPLRRHDVVNDGVQTTVTIHDTTAWTHPDEVGAAAALWSKTMAKRAYKYADAIVVPSHAVAENLSNYIDFGDRVRVITSGTPTSVLSASSSDDRPISPEISVPYVIVEGSLSVSDDVEAVIAAFSASGNAELDETHLVVVSSAGIGAEPFSAMLAKYSLDASRVRLFSQPSGNERRSIYSGAAALVVPWRSDRFASSLLTAFSLGLPVVHADTPVLNEIAGDAGIVVSTTETDDHEARADAYRESLQNVLADDQARSRLSTLGQDRSKAFSWRETGERIWQLHAEL
ncbi:glycosyltransferase [Lysinibacter cavernae]|uniref:Glycosyltransferase involved in cell wall biosynthesis n=1 Tax=Lysinibacter cavernae TaxID=1640652 RepID=A0A7X5R4A6_9MICO|nr:glycosyltransferase [Lysinibacter cavernae]NIH55112.1 glycosyltransferase involved in cell wall biosynthesis [Lysinibacter cavernae]